MRPSGGVSVGMNGLSSLFELDLSQKPAQIIERVGSWSTYADAPLGWTLSNTSFDGLRSQLTIDENRIELEEIQRWLSGGLTCEDRE